MNKNNRIPKPEKPGIFSDELRKEMLQVQADEWAKLESISGEQLRRYAAKQSAQVFGLERLLDNAMQTLHAQQIMLLKVGNSLDAVINGEPAELTGFPLIADVVTELKKLNDE